MRLAYADPPYPGRAHLYADHPDYAGEVDHFDLVARLLEYDGWALSTNSDSLAYVLSCCPRAVRVAAWVRTNAPPFNPDGYGSVRSWEPVVFMPAREVRLAPDRVCDVLTAPAPTGAYGAGLTGAKSSDFAVWVFKLLSAEPDDRLDDLFPGTGCIAREWDRWSSQPTLFAAATGGRMTNTDRPAHVGTLPLAV